MMTLRAHTLKRRGYGEYEYRGHVICKTFGKWRITKDDIDLIGGVVLAWQPTRKAAKALIDDALESALRS